ncbi:MAG TPA: hypothetical protein VGP47_07295 [Parachlamydiaceae bacterium]|nr:hypothetical protein [Parachlamydiaceae bacterium]
MADEAMELFWEDLDSGEVHIRDKWQFALKSEFFPKKGSDPSLYTQEFYLFIPNSLQINSTTYSKQSFYLDQTNLIRYKTPEFSFEQLLDGNSNRSPLTRIISLCDQTDNADHRSELSDELKLMANVVRSTMRHEIKHLVFLLSALQSPSSLDNFTARTLELCENIQKLRSRYALAEQKCLENWNDAIFYRQMLYIDEFLSYSITHYLTGLLESVRLTGRDDMETVDNALCEVLLKEKQLSDLLLNHGNKSLGDTEEGENVLYRYSLLNKFVLDALHLTTNRFSLDQRYQHWIGAASAGIAMMLYFSLFVWLGTVFVMNSEPFIILTVFFYILKDRIKEWLRVFSYLQASRWFPDYTTVIRSQEGKGNVGVIRESFSILDPHQLSKELNDIRNAGFHSVLETVQRPENVLFYKRVVEINATPANERRYGVNVIFRFNVQHFLRKAGDPTETHLIIDPKTRKLISIRLPKVYHLNLIIRSTTSEEDKAPKMELKKLKIVVDKNGIKRIEQLSRSN